MSREINAENPSAEDRAYLAQREGLHRVAPLRERVEALPPVNPGNVNSELVDINAKGERTLAFRGDLTSIPPADPDLAFARDESDIDPDDPARTQVGFASEGGDVQFSPEEREVSDGPIADDASMADSSEAALADPELSGANEVSDDDDDSTVEAQDGDNYADLTNEELRDIIRDRNAKGADMPTGGPKAALVARLRADDGK